MSEQLDRGLLGDDLQEELRDLLALAVVADHVRWVAVGTERDAEQEWLAGAASQCRAWADQVAKQMVSVGIAPDGRVRSLAKGIPVHWVPDGWLRQDEAARLVAERLDILAGWTLYRQSQASDPDSERLLDGVAAGLEEYASEGRRMLRRSFWTVSGGSRALTADPRGEPVEVGKGSEVES
jgi:starvation-inducible DNA-binding protein